MTERIKYLNILVLLAFLVGQVQYAYASFFCTMKDAPVSVSSMIMNTDEEDSQPCGECSCRVHAGPGQQVVEANCMLMHIIEKTTIDNFRVSDRSVSTVSRAWTLCGNQLPAGNRKLFTKSYQGFNPTNSPPLDLPTFNSTLRI